MAEEWPPKFANKLGTPKYTVVEKTDDYELREYEVSKWVTTDAKKVSWRSASYTNFMKLFRYIQQGANVGEQKIAMTSPVLTNIIPGKDKPCEDDYTMSFFVDPVEGTAPDPTEATVRLTEQPKQKVYVRSFGGWCMWTFNTWHKEAEKLKKAIGDESKYHSDHYYTAGYNSPMQLFNRHNEVWFIAKD